MKRPFLNVVMPLSLLLFTATAHAAFPGIDNAGLFDSLLQRFASTASMWGNKMVGYGTWLFWSLALLSMVWTFGLMALKKADIQEFFAETIRFFAVTGFFLWILTNGPEMSMAIIDTLRQVAAHAAGLSGKLSPSGIVDIGFDIASKVADMSSIWSPASSIVGLAIAAIILVILALVSVNMLLMLISAWLIAYAGVFLLGFGGGRWTQDIAIQYYKTVLGIGVQIFTMILIVGIGHSFIDQYYAKISDDMALKELFVMLVVSIILLKLTDKLPPILASITGGASSSGGSSGMGSFGMGAAVGAVGMGAAMASSAAASSLGMASSLAGGASAIQAAFQSAQQGMSSAGSGSGSGNSLASAMGTAGRFAADMGASLAKGVAQTMGDKIDAVKEASQDSISNTFGGKVASAIKNADSVGAPDSSSNTFSPDASNESFDGNGLSAGQSDEVADFVNKSSPMDKEN